MRRTRIRCEWACDAFWLISYFSCQPRILEHTRRRLAHRAMGASDMKCANGAFGADPHLAHLTSNAPAAGPFGSTDMKCANSASAHMVVLSRIWRNDIAILASRRERIALVLEGIFRNQPVQPCGSSVHTAVIEKDPRPHALMCQMRRFLPGDLSVYAIRAGPPWQLKSAVGSRHPPPWPG